MLSRLSQIILGLSVCAAALAQGLGDAEFSAAYHALAQKDYDSAITHFRIGLAKQPSSPSIHKDLGYTLLKTGENEAARGEFETALDLDSHDEQAALEYAFLANETGRPADARRIFGILRNSKSPATRKTADRAFQNIDAARTDAATTDQPCPTTQSQPSELPIQASEAGWSNVLQAVGLTQASSGITFIQGSDSKAAELGVHRLSGSVTIRQIIDEHNPRLPIVWGQSEVIETVELPPAFHVFAREKCTDAPVLAGERTASGVLLWTATSPGKKGFERYPYLIQALADLGVSLPLRSPNLWAFFDSSYRMRADVDYLAQHWRDAGISALHVGAWHNMEADPAADEYLARLIEACHRRAILVYAWLELPFVSEQFWADHPEWREKNVLGQDAQIGWRRPMNLQNSECSRAAAAQIDRLLKRFDWDGINLAQLSFDSPEAAPDPARFTPMNDNVRAEFKEIADFDPALLFDSTSPHAANKKELQTFLGFRTVVASRMQSEWRKTLENVRNEKPFLDLVLTNSNARAEMLITDSSGKSIGIDLSVIDRNQDAPPTGKPTGVELLQAVHESAHSFSRVALYSESSIAATDLPLIGAAAATAKVMQQSPGVMDVDSPQQVRVSWKGNADVDGQPWPIRDDRYLTVPAGQHTITAGAKQPPVVLTDFNGEIQCVTTSQTEVSVAYQSRTRVPVGFDPKVAAVTVDDAMVWKAAAGKSSNRVMLPAGQHLAVFTRR